MRNFSHKKNILSIEVERSSLGPVREREREKRARQREGEIETGYNRDGNRT